MTGDSVFPVFLSMESPSGLTAVTGSVCLNRRGHCLLYCARHPSSGQHERLRSKRLLCPVWHTQLLCESSLAFEHDNMFQAHPVPSLIQSWAQPVLQKNSECAERRQSADCCWGDTVARWLLGTEIGDLQLIKWYVHRTVLASISALVLWLFFCFYNWIFILLDHCQHNSSFVLLHKIKRIVSKWQYEFYY